MHARVANYHPTYLSHTVPPRTLVNITNQHMRGDGNMGHSAPFIRSPALTTRGGNMPPEPGVASGMTKAMKESPTPQHRGRWYEEVGKVLISAQTPKARILAALCNQG